MSECGRRTRGARQSCPRAGQDWPQIGMSMRIVLDDNDDTPNFGVAVMYAFTIGSYRRCHTTRRRESSGTRIQRPGLPICSSRNPYSLPVAGPTGVTKRMIDIGEVWSGRHRVFSCIQMPHSGTIVSSERYDGKSRSLTRSCDLNGRGLEPWKTRASSDAAFPSELA